MLPVDLLSLWRTDEDNRVHHCPDELTKILTHLGEPTEPPVISPARGPPQYDLFDDAA